MGTVFVDNLEPQSGTSLTLGASGDTLQIASGVINNLGISQADQWRLTTDVTTNGEITSGLERVDTGSFNYIGTGMTESSGVFTFPSTGIYLIHYCARINVASGDSGFLYATVATDGSTFGNNLGYLYQTSGSGTGGGTSANIGFFDVTNTSTHKIRFEAASLASGSSIAGNTSETATGFTFIRLGDT